MIYRFAYPFFLSACAATVSAISAEAVTVPGAGFVESSTRTATASYEKIAPDGTAVTILQDTDTFDATGAVAAEIRTSVGDLGSTNDRAAPGRAKSDINIAGFSGVFIDGIVNSSSFGSTRLYAEVSETITGSVPSVGNVEVTYSFELIDMFVEIWDDSTDGVGSSGFDQIFGRVWYEILLNDVTTYRMAATASGGRLLPDIGTTSTIFSVDPDVANTDITVIPDGTGPGDVPRTVRFGEIVERDLVVGSLFGSDAAPAGEFELKINMGAELLLPDFELDVGGRVAIGDPNTFAFGFDNLNFEIPDDTDVPAPIPLPAASWMLIAGLAALFGIRRRIL